MTPLADVIGWWGFCVLDQLRGIVRQMEGIVHHMGVVHHHIGEFLRHIGKFLDNGTQFGVVKGLIGSASLVEGWAISLRGVWEVLDQLGGIVRQMEGIVHHMGVVHHHIGEFLRHLEKFLDNGTQFGVVKGLIGSASLVWGWAISLREGWEVLDQLRGLFDKWRGLFIRWGVVLHHIARFLRHIGKFLDNGTQFGVVKTLISSASLVEGWAISLRVDVWRFEAFSISCVGLSVTVSGLFISWE